MPILRYSPHFVVWSDLGVISPEHFAEILAKWDIDDAAIDVVDGRPRFRFSRSESLVSFDCEGWKFEEAVEYAWSVLKRARRCND